MTNYTFPTYAEIEAIERHANAMRAQVVANAFKSLKARIVHFAQSFQRHAHN
ncbi:RSP_7527 family protein [Oceanibium sediminis]|uniref:RSP_7527 family protein n=1 Tax=Oceanibium sediminis TaxID=2026339 RepID=UPI00130087A9|nr:hypothetical protein [Oceanibium sediminis]